MCIVFFLQFFLGHSVIFATADLGLSFFSANLYYIFEKFLVFVCSIPLLKNISYVCISYLVPICVDILSWVFFTACLACIYLSNKPQFGFKNCLLRSWLKMKFFPGYVFPLVALLTVT